MELVDRYRVPSAKKRIPAVSGAVFRGVPSQFKSVCAIGRTNPMIKSPAVREEIEALADEMQVRWINQNPVCWDALSGCWKLDILATVLLGRDRRTKGITQHPDFHTIDQSRRRYQRELSFEPDGLEGLLMANLARRMP